MFSIKPGTIVVAKNLGHSNELLEVGAILNDQKFTDKAYQMEWVLNDFRAADELEISLGFRHDQKHHNKYEWSLFPDFVNWAYVQPDKTLVLSSHQPTAFNADRGYSHSNTSLDVQLLEMKDHPYTALYSSASLEQRPLNENQEFAQCH